MQEIINLQPMQFELETNTVWSFPERGKWATHDSKYRGNYSPYVAKNIILRYSQEGDTVLDQFVGGGTTLIECKLNKRNGIGIDINAAAVSLTSSKLQFACADALKSVVEQGDARNLTKIADDSIDLICTHPPYADIIQYSENIEGDLSRCDEKAFLNEMRKVAGECHRVLKRDKFCAIVMGDMRKKGMVRPLGFEVMQLFNCAGFVTKEIVIKEQHNCKATGFWKTNSEKFNFLLLAHEYVFIFKKTNI